MNPSIAILLAVYTAASGIGASVTLEVTFTTTPDLRVAELRQHRLRHRHHAEGVGLEHLAHRGHRRGLEDADDPDARVVDEHVDGPARLDRGRDALGLRDVERQHPESFRSGQDVFARRSHGGDHVPSLRVEVAGGFEAVARGATGDEYVFSLTLHETNVATSELDALPCESPHFICESPDMNDPLSEVIALLQPRTVFSKRISGAGRWGVRYSDFGQPSFCAVLEGSCRLAVDGQRALTLEAGDFVLLPATPGFTMSGFEPVRPERIDPKVTASHDR